MPHPHIDVSIASLATPTDLTAFREINEDWISRLFTLTDEDRRLLADPIVQIVRPGGDVLIAHDASGEAVGCVALVSYGDGIFELAKMGVTQSAQGAGIGRRLIDAAIRRGTELGARRLFLGTSTRLEAAVHLYEAAGFHRITRDRLPVADYYARADILLEISLA